MSDSEDLDSFPSQFRRNHKPCRFWKGKKGSCPAGEKCNFRHERQRGAGIEGSSSQVNEDEGSRGKKADKAIVDKENISIIGDTSRGSHDRDTEADATATAEATGREEASTSTKGKEVAKNSKSLQICRMWTAGKCRRAGSCPYRHVKAEEPSVATPIQKIIALPESKVSSAHSSAKSPGSPTQVGICIDWRRGSCRRGQQCRFRHEASGVKPGMSESLRIAPAILPDAKVHPIAETSSSMAAKGDGSDAAPSKPIRAVGVCWDWQDGRCHKPNCRYRHQNLPTSNFSNPFSSFVTIPPTSGEGNQKANRISQSQRPTNGTKTREQAQQGNRQKAAETRRLIEEVQRKEAEEREAKRKRQEELQAQEERRREEARLMEERRREEERLAEERRKEEEKRMEEERQRKEEEKRRQNVLRQQERKRKAEEKRRREEEERIRIEQERRREEERRAEARRRAEEQRREQERAARAAKEARWREEAAVTQQFVVADSSMITCSAGLDIQHVVAGFDLCRIKIRNLPLNARPQEITDIFTQQGVSTGDFFVSEVRRFGNKLEATALANADQGEAIALGLDGIEFREDTLSFEVTDNTTSFIKNNNPFMTVSWKGGKVQTETLVATYCSRVDAQRWAKRIDGKDWNGFKLKAAPAVLEHNFQVTITNCPPDSAYNPSTHVLTGTCNVQAPNPAEETNDATILGGVRDHIFRQRGIQEDTYKVVLAEGNVGEIKVTVHFDTWDNLKRAHASIHKKRILARGGNLSPVLHVWHSKPLHYSGVVPNRQYGAQRKQWDALAERKPGREAWVHVRAGDRGDAMLVRILGEDKQAAGALKVRAEALVAGETLDAAHWHPSFLASVGRQFFDRVHQETKAHVRSDFKTRVVKVYGDPEMIEAARTMIREEVERKAAEEMFWTLDHQAVGFFVREGLGRLKELIGDDNVQLQVACRPAKITIKGGEEARHHLQRLIEESRTATHLVTGTDNEELICPVCYSEATNPEQLGCGHTYCAGCLQHFLSSAADTKTFPLVCMGNDATCKTPISIPFMRRFIHPHVFQHLIEVAFTCYLEQHPQELKYCTTPDCKQVYRRQSPTRASRCPSCFKTICSSCDDEAHDNMSCEEARLLRNPAEQERRNQELMDQSGYKKCPRCSVWIEKTEGCNHMSCRCGAHICWRCLAVFDSGTETYAHLNSVHGTYLDVDEPPAWAGPGPFVNIVAEQADLLAALERQRQAEARPVAPRAPVAPVPAAIWGNGVDRADDDARLRAERLRRMRAAELEERARRDRLVEEAQRRRMEEYRRNLEQRQAEQRRQEEMRRAAEARRRQEEEQKGWCIVM